MSNETTTVDEEEPGVRDHVEDVQDGCGCAEVWEELGARRSDDGEESVAQSASDD